MSYDPRKLLTALIQKLGAKPGTVTPPATSAERPLPPAVQAEIDKLGEAIAAELTKQNLFGEPLGPCDCPLCKSRAAAKWN